MQYIIMLIIVIGLALSDFITGFIKAYAVTSISIFNKAGSRSFRIIIYN